MAILWLLVPGVPMLCYGLAATFNWFGLARRLAVRGVIPLLLLQLPPDHGAVRWMWRGGVGTARLTRMYRMAGFLYIALGQLALSAVGIAVGGPIGLLLIVLAPVLVVVWCVVKTVGALIHLLGRVRRHGLGRLPHRAG